MKKPIALLAATLVMVVITSSCASQPGEPPPTDPSLSGSSESSNASTHVIRRAENEADYPNHGITTTKVEPKPGDNVTTSSALMIRLSLDDLIEKSDAVVTGKVVDIHPARYETETLASSFLTIFTDVIVQTEFYLYGEPQSTYIAVRVMGGRVGEKTMLVEDEPVFNLGEKAVMFLTRINMLTIPPEGIAPDNYYRVTGAMQGKLGCKDSTMITFEGDSVTLSEIEQKIASIHGGE